MTITWLEPSTHPELSEELIREAEAHFGVEFPPAWLELLREQNGGYIELLLAPVPSPFPEEARYYVGDGFVSINQIFGIDPAPLAAGSIYCSADMAEEWELPAGLVLLDGDGHTWLALDYRTTQSAPGVVFVIADGGLVVPLADSFEELVSALVPHSSVFDEDGHRI